MANFLLPLGLVEGDRKPKGLCCAMITALEAILRICACDAALVAAAAVCGTGLPRNAMWLLRVGKSHHSSLMREV